MLIAPRHVLHAVRVVLDAAGVQQEAGLRRAPPLGRLPDRPLGDAGHLGRPPRRPLAARARPPASKPTVCCVDEVVVEPVVLDHQVQDAVEQGGVAARLDRQEQVAGAGERRDARIDDDDLRARARAPARVVGGDRRALGDVGAADPDDLGLRGCPTTGWPRGRCRTPSCSPAAGADHAEPAVVVDVRRLQADAGELAHQVAFSVVRLAPPSTREGVAAVLAWMRSISAATRAIASS